VIGAAGKRYFLLGFVTDAGDDDRIALFGQLDAGAADRTGGATDDDDFAGR
jgi:hypothetical protein